jgi:hypothetical protein
MKAKAEGEQPADQAQEAVRPMDSLIGRRLLDALGKPADTYRVQVRRLWEGHYRVTLFAGMDPASTRIAGSYFLVVDGEGSILTSTPTITG